MTNKIIRFFLDNKLASILLLLSIIIGGLITSPFPSDSNFLPKSPVPVDAIPDIGENQQIIFTKWMGRSPQDIEDQITYPLTSSLLGIPGVKTIRSSSMFGFSNIYVIFEDDIEFYWSRSRILEKLNSLPQGLLPEGVQASLGPDATGLGQIFWYTIEGRDEEGNVAGGWDLEEIRSIQDYQVKYALASAKGVSEVASIGGHVKEYQIDLDPTAMKAYNISLSQVISSIKKSNSDVGARTIEINKAEYFVRGTGYIKSLSDIENSSVKLNNNTPILIKDIAKVSFGPATRRGILDKMGAEVVGGVVVARYGANPLEVINNVKEKIKEIAPGLGQKTLEDGRISKLTIIPFYDRTELIYETLGTLKEALSLEILICVIVIIIMLMNLRASIIISSLIPIAVLSTFIAMRYFNVDANIVALSGIAIAIGTIVDVGIVLSENIIQHLDKAPKDKKIKEVIYQASIEVMPAIITAILTTIVSFVPVFALEAAEGKLFRPLAFTKTFVLMSALGICITILPSLAYFLFSIKIKKKKTLFYANIILFVIGFISLFILPIALGVLIILLATLSLISEKYPQYKEKASKGSLLLIISAICYVLTKEWLPLGASNSLFANYIFVIVIIGVLLSAFLLFIKFYSRILEWALANKAIFLSIPTSLVILGIIIAVGFNSTFGFIANLGDKVGVNIRTTKVWSAMHHEFPGVAKEFMPSLNEGSFLLMPTSMPHSGLEENKKTLKQLDIAVSNIPEIDMVVGKLGRVESALDPAPISMYENIINYKSEYKTNAAGEKKRFAVDDEGVFLRDKKNKLIEDNDGDYFRQWRDHIKSPDDIWDEIIKATNFPGVTSAPKLQPIETRIVMLQTGMRAPIGIKIKGSNLEEIQDFGFALEKLIKEVDGVKKASVFAERMIGKPYLELDIDRVAIAKYGLSVDDIQKVIAINIGGVKISSTLEGRERYPIRVRYPRELRDDPESIKNIQVNTPSGKYIPLGDLVNVIYKQGPQSIKSENTFLVSYVILDKEKGFSEVEVVNKAQEYINSKIKDKTLKVPPGISFTFTGNYENQVRAEKRLSLIVPIVFVVIFLILYFQFKNIMPTLMVFSGIAVAFSGGFIMIHLYSLDWFMNIDILGTNIRELFQMQTIYLSVAVWVGFIALFGIATDDGVLMSTYMEQTFAKDKPSTVKEIRKAVLTAGNKRIRPCLMTTATTILALLPILTSTGKGSDIMIPMAIPALGGMSVELISLFVVPVLYSLWKEKQLKNNGGKENV